MGLSTNLLHKVFLGLLRGTYGGGVLQSAVLQLRQVVRIHRLRHRLVPALDLPNNKSIHIYARRQPPEGIPTPGNESTPSVQLVCEAGIQEEEEGPRELLRCVP